MATYKLKALSVSGLGNRVYRIEDNQILTDAHFPAGRAEQLVAGGFLEKIAESKAPEKPKVSKPAANKPTKVEKPAATPAPDAPKKVEAAKSFDEISYQELKEYLTKKGITFKPAGESRKNLYALYEKSFSAATPAPDAPKKETPVAIEEINVADLEKHLTAKGIEFDTEEDKDTLYAKYLTSFA